MYHFIFGLRGALGARQPLAGAARPRPTACCALRSFFILHTAFNSASFDSQPNGARNNATSDPAVPDHQIHQPEITRTETP